MFRKLLFSQRVGLAPIEPPLQLNAISDELRIALWNALCVSVFNQFSTSGTFRALRSGSEVRDSNLWPLLSELWADHFNRPLDEIPDRWDKLYGVLREWFFKTEWDQVFDLIEFVGGRVPDEFVDHLSTLANDALERFNSGYRFIGGAFVEITSEQELGEVDAALSAPFATVRQHLKRALELLADRAKPDYRNSIKESISGVEALAREVSGEPKATLGDLLKVLEREKRLHPALAGAFAKLYGYTNDADGIRHSLTDEGNLTAADARFMLVTCSAFVHYVIDTVRDRR